MEKRSGNEVGEKIRYYRKQRGMSQEELASALGISHVHVSRYESGTRKPKLEQLRSIASALGVGVNELTDVVGETSGGIVSLLLKLDEGDGISWHGDMDKNGNYVPSSVSISFNDEAVNRALSTYLKYRDQIKNRKPSEVVFTEGDGTQITVEELRGRILSGETKKRKPMA